MSRIDADEIRRQHTLVAVAGRETRLRKDGREWRGLCPLHAENTPSFTIFTGKDGAERFECFGCGAGGDVIDFVRELKGVGFRDACEILAGAPAEDAPKKRRAAAPVDPYAGYRVLMPPADAPTFTPGEPTGPLLNPKRAGEPGKGTANYRPSHVHGYRDRNGRLAGYVLRVPIGDGKITPTILWMRNRSTGFVGWSHGAMPTPRPMYGLADALERPGAQVLIVEGEKCADAARDLSPKLVAVSWCGGVNAWALTNWRPIAGRSVALWPDNDAGGETAMLGGPDRHGEWRPGLADTLAEMGCRVRVIPREGDAKPKGWDIANMLAETSPAETLEYMRGRAVAWEPREEVRTPDGDRLRDISSTDETSPGPHDDAGRGAPPSAPELRPTEQAAPDPVQTLPPRRKSRAVGDNVVSLRGEPVDTGDNWRGRLITDGDGNVRPKSTENYFLFAAFHAKLKGTFGWDDFGATVVIEKQPPWEPRVKSWARRPVRDYDVPALRGYLEQFSLTPTRGDAKDTILRAARELRSNPVLDYFEGLTWDGIPRVQGGLTGEGDTVAPWLSEYMEAPPMRINQAFGMRWLISAVARAYRPGCKADNMLIIEGPQGKRKSAALRVIGTLDGKVYFTDGLHDLQGKDNQQLLRGMLIVEMAELQAMSRSDVSQTKKWLSTQEDYYRPPYGTVPETFPRTCVFAGTVNPGSTGYLKDATGARRFWPVKVGDIDLERLAADRDHIWAEAVRLFKSGQQWWLTPEEDAMAALAADRRYEVDPWAAHINRIVASEEYRATWRATDLMDGMKIPIERQTSLTEKRIGDHLLATGFCKERDEERPKEYVYRRVKS